MLVYQRVMVVMENEYIKGKTMKKKRKTTLVFTNELPN